MPRTHVWWRTRGPKTTPKETLTKGKVRIKQDSPALRGQIKHVRHLVEVTPVEEGRGKREGGSEE